MSSKFKSVPVIDISHLYSSKLEDRLKVAKSIGAAAHDVGFMYVTGHRVPDSVISGVRSAAQEFFDLSMEQKMELYIGKSTCHKGYVPEGEEIFDPTLKPDHKEAIDIGRDFSADHPLVKAQLPLLGLNQWPSEEKLPKFRERVVTYFNEVSDLSKVLIHGFALALDQEETEFDQYFKDPVTTLRLVHYPYDDEAKQPDRQGIGEHTDYECFTILLADSPGLEVVNGDNEWIPAPPIPNTFVVNIGDLLEVMTNNKLTATAHRVRKVQQERFSFPMFVGCDYFTEIKPFKQFVTENTGLDKKYSSIISGDHIWASIMQTHKYLIDKVNSGEMKYPDGTRAKGTFGPSVLSAGAL